MVWFKRKKYQNFNNVEYELTEKHDLDINNYYYYINRKLREDIINKPLIYIKNKMKVNSKFLCLKKNP